MKSWLNKPVVLLLVLTLTIYLPGVNAPFVWDDEQFIYKNQYVQNLDLQQIWNRSTTAGAGVVSNYFRPLTSTTFAFDRLFWGDNTFGYHLTNIFFHFLAGLLIYLLLKELTQNQHLALTITILFLVHPIQAESVQYINARADSLYVFWGVMAIWLWVTALNQKYLALKLYNLSIKIGLIWLIIGGWLAYLLSILSKEIGLAMAGLMVAAAGVIWLQKPASRRRIFFLSLFNLFALTIIAAGYLYWRNFLVPFNNTQDILVNYPESYSHLSTRLITFSKVLLIYFRLLVFPYPLHMEQTTTPVENLINPYSLITILLIIFLGYTGWKEKIKHHSLYIWQGALWFILPLTPVSGIVPVNGLIYQHWLYLPMIGFWLMLYGLIKLYLPHFNFRFFWWLIVVLMILSWHQVYIWSDPIRLYRHTLKYSPTARVYNNLGMELANRGWFQSALETYNESLMISRSYPQTFHNLGNVYVQLNQPEEAIRNYTRAIEIDKSFLPSYKPLISLLRQNNQPELALDWQQKYQEIFTNN